MAGMRAIPRYWLPAVLLGFLPGGEADAGTGRAFPVASVGDIWFQADHAGFRSGEGKVVQEYYLRILNNQLSFVAEEDGRLRGRVYVELRFKGSQGEELSDAGHQFEFTVADDSTARSPDHAQLLALEEPLDPRAHSVEFQVEDLNARKRGLLYLFTGKRKNGIAEAVLSPPPFAGKPFGLSDLQFAWEVHQANGTGPFEKNGLEVIPNPQRSYGLLQSRLTAYYEVYDLRSEIPLPRTYLVSHELVDPKGSHLTVKPDTVQSESGEWVKVVSFDLSQLMTGEHRMRAVVFHPASGETAVAERAFHVLWKSELWDMTERDLLDEARVVFREEEYERFRDMSAGDRARYVEDFWKRVDPSPGTARNELREEFLRRMAYANQQFSEHGKGMLTDRGRIYIRFGEPDEVIRELIPTQGDQLDAQVRDLSRENISGGLLSNNEVVDTRPYEIWNYTRQGQPLFPERETTTSVTGLRFVFIDETSVGHYVLRYASDFIGY